MLLSDLHSYALKSYPEKDLEQFCTLICDKDFEGAIQVLHDKILPKLKKKNLTDYYSELLSINVEMTLTYDFKPNYQEVISEALGKSNFYGILKFLNKLSNSRAPQRYYGDLLYVMEEILKRPATDVPPHVKHCMFHLFARLMTNRELGKLAKTSLKPYFYYFQVKYHCFDESDPLETALYQQKIRQNDFKDAWQQFFNPSGSTATKRTTLKDIEKMMTEMDQCHADEVHYLFMCNYIDYSRYNFRDEWMIDRYVETYNAYFQESPIYLYTVNDYVLEILKEWQKDTNYKYQKAKKDMVFWMTDPIPAFKPSMGEEIEAAWQKVCNADNEKIIAEAFLPFPYKILEMVKSGQYEDAAANVYCILEHLAIANKAHEDWFDCLWNGGEQTDVVNLVEVLQELYSHLRQLKDLPTNLKNEMDIHLEIFNKKTSFFGIDCGDSRYDDMLLDGKKQYGNYADLSNCYMWTEWYLPKLRGEN